jgi:hypothetical protein
MATYTDLPNGSTILRIDGSYVACYPNHETAVYVADAYAGHAR